MLKLTTPLSEETVRSLKLGDTVLLSGVIVTARDAAHKFMIENKPDFIRPYLKDSVIYHCGPVVRKDEKGEWHFVSSGPTTSSREEAFEATVIKEYGVRGCIGKGGMGAITAKGLQESGAVYFHAIGGAGSLIAKRVVKVLNVFKMEDFGTPEAFWVIKVEDFPVVVTMDSHGNSLHAQIAAHSAKVLKELVAD